MTKYFFTTKTNTAIIFAISRTNGSFFGIATASFFNFFQNLFTWFFINEPPFEQTKEVSVESEILNRTMNDMSFIKIKHRNLHSKINSN